ncbi:MAG: hypothetical protein D6686_13485 [Alphaproteobacteria bacterium]|nr:MAG: hypothetical protein D6686_13485 [Alphaproteobacteria bacterium]
MPTHIRAILTVIVLIVTGAAYALREVIGLQSSPLLIFGLGVGMAISLWLFPEPRKEKPTRR